MARGNKNTAYGLVAVGLIIVVIALTCMMLNSDDKLCASGTRRKSKTVKWPWVPDDFNGPMYLAPPGFLSGSTEQPPSRVDGPPMRLLKNQYQCPETFTGCWSGCDYPIPGARECPYYHASRSATPASAGPYGWGAYYLKGSPYSPQGYPGYTKKETLRANSRLGIPRTFSPIDSCKVGYDYGVYSNNACIPYMSTKEGPASLIDY